MLLSLEVISEQLGRSSIRVTKDNDAHMMTSSKMKATDALSRPGGIAVGLRGAQD
jgi:hypothetical protein